MVNTARVNVDYMTKLLPMEKREFSAIPFLLHLMFDQTLSNYIFCLMISQKLRTKLCKRTSILQWIQGKQNCS